MQYANKDWNWALISEMYPNAYKHLLKWLKANRFKGYQLHQVEFMHVAKHKICPLPMPLNWTWLFFNEPLELNLDLQDFIDRMYSGEGDGLYLLFDLLEDKIKKD
jgi:hypothetical protein